MLLAQRGEGVDHPSAAANIAALVEVAATKPGSRILNAADPDAPSALEISRTIARLLDHPWTEVQLDADAADGDADADADEMLGRTPWDRPYPVVLDTTAATSLGYVPVGDYATTVADEVAWLVAAARGGEDADLLQGADEALGPFLDYAGEDRYLARHPELVTGRA